MVTACRISLHVAYLVGYHDMIKSDRNSWKSRFTDNVQNLWRVDCIMYGETTRVLDTSHSYIQDPYTVL